MSSAVSNESDKILTPLDSISWALAETKITDDDLLNLANRTDLVIREVGAPLSSVSAKTLTFFLETHGSNLERLNLQNCRISGEDFANLAEKVPRLKTLSFQYLHDVRDKDLLRIIQTCKNLETLRISQNRGISKKVFHQILELNRSFSELSLDIFGTSKRNAYEDTNAQTTQAKVETIRLSGLSFNDDDIANIAAIKGLRTVRFALTKVQPEAVARFCTSSSSEERLTVEIIDISKKNLAAFEMVFKRENLAFSRIDEKTIRIRVFQR